MTRPSSSSTRSRRARIAALARTTQPGYDGRAATQKARDARLARYCAQVDPDNSLPEEERIRRANKAWRADCERGKLQASRGRRSRPAA